MAQIDATIDDIEKQMSQPEIIEDHVRLLDLNQQLENLRQQQEELLTDGKPQLRIRRANKQIINERKRTMAAKKMNITKPKYQQIAVDLAEKISNNKFHIGDKIHARSTLAQSIPGFP